MVCGSKAVAMRTIVVAAATPANARPASNASAARSTRCRRRAGNDEVGSSMPEMDAIVASALWHLGTSIEAQTDHRTNAEPESVQRDAGRHSADHAGKHGQRKACGRWRADALERERADRHADRHP